MSRAENSKQQVGYTFPEKVISAIFPSALRNLASWEVLTLQEREMMGSNGKIRRNVRNYIDTFVEEYRGATRDFASWTQNPAYESVDDEILTYKLVSAIEVDFDKNIDTFYSKIVKPDWHLQVRSMQARILSDEAAEALIVRSQKLDGNIVDHLRLTARRMINWGVNTSEASDKVLIDRTWVNSLGMRLLGGERLPQEVRDMFRNSPPKAFER